MVGRRILTWLTGPVWLLALAGCSGPALPGGMPGGLSTAAPAPSREAFLYCHGHGCRTSELLAFDAAEWQAITAPLATAAPDPAGERRQLAAAAAALEHVAGRHTGTAEDRAGTFAAFGQPGQLDCIDEALNMTRLLHLLARAGLLRHHDPGEPVGRGALLDRWPHYAATLRERASGADYVLDAWYRDNGEPALVLPLDVWRAGLDEPLLACLRASGDLDGRDAAPGTGEASAACYAL